LVRGKTIQEAKGINPRSILENLEAYSIKDFDCPSLVVKTLEELIEKYEQK